MEVRQITDNIAALIERIGRREYTVGVIGLGYVGLPLVLRFGEIGFPVLGFDIDPVKVHQLNSGSSYITHIAAERVSALTASRRFEATGDFSRLREPDALIICVPTPLSAHREPDLQYVTQTADLIAAHLRAGQLVCLESTTYPGTTDEELLPRFSTRGLRVGEDFFLAFSPEREDPGNRDFTTSTIPKVVGAYKRDADDIRESPAFEILTLLEEKGALVEYADPYFPVLPMGRRRPMERKGVSLTAESIGEFDAAVLVTDHSAFPYELIHRSAALIVDSRNAFRSRGFRGSHLFSA